MDESDIIKKVQKLNTLAKEYTLSHAVLATTEKIEKRRNSIKTSEYQAPNEDIRDDVIFTLNNIKELEKIAEERKNNLDNNGTKVKVYISMSASDKPDVREARTFFFRRKMLPESDVAGLSVSVSEHFEIILPPKKDEYDGPAVFYDENKNISKKSRRFLVGHELGHLWLHLDDIIPAKDVHSYSGTGLLSKLDKKLESEATIFSNKLSEYRDKHFLEMAELIKTKKNS